MTTIVSFASLIALLGLPLFLVLGFFAIIGFSSESLPHTIYFAELMRLAGNPTLIAIPFFTLGGFILAESQAPKRLINLARALLGWLPGGLGVVTVLVMALLTSFTGASGVTIIALGGLMLPALVKGGMGERFSLGLLTTSGSIGLLFPPSLPLILYGVVSETPIEKLFLGGMLPGILMVAGMAALSIYQGVRKGKVVDYEKVSIFEALKSAIWEIPLPLVVIGGIYGGFFTATEAAVITVAYVLIVEVLITKDVQIRTLPRIMQEATVLVGGILLIIGSALALTNYLVFVDAPTILLSWIESTLTSRFTFLLALNIFLLIVGSLMDIFSALVVVVPLILPLAARYGIDPVHLGIIFLANLELGYNHPPMGLNLFIASFRFNKPIVEVIIAAIPFLILHLLILGIITYWPALTLAPITWFGQ